MKKINTNDRFNKTVCLKTEMDDFMEYIGLDAKLHELKILNLWDECVGESISRFSNPVELKKNKLFVKAENAAWRYELSLKKVEIINKLNERLGKKLIREIVFI
ncbi:MAG TPA: DUF721 domain-containing protein [Ignavibacteria bacterium]|nr:DUF721 domain-containing protein [Ignavibacteria bacterium]HQY51351.1 DUF721 domain-containing protein [Ignavibacteria bacterium]HRA99730.1 DUF721 domain-containing protein [Ignavibacteria bacterium]